MGVADLNALLFAAAHNIHFTDGGETRHHQLGQHGVRFLGSNYCLDHYHSHTQVTLS
ncbi:hypothetical protein D3C80_2153340 [compost metagenome]